MAIDYMTDIVTGFYAGDVATDAAYESPGTFGLPTNFGGSNAGKRLLTMIEVLRAYIGAIENVHEQKLMATILARMVAEMKFGANYSATVVAADAQKAALDFIAGNGKALIGI